MTARSNTIADALAFEAALLAAEVALAAEPFDECSEEAAFEHADNYADAELAAVLQPWAVRHRAAGAGALAHLVGCVIDAFLDREMLEDYYLKHPEAMAADGSIAAFLEREMQEDYYLKHPEAIAADAESIEGLNAERRKQARSDPSR